MTFLTLEKLIQKIEERKNAEVHQSYTASLLAHAPEKPLRKLSEEVTELLIDVLKGDFKGATKEAADVLYHYLVVLAAADISFSEDSTICFSINFLSSKRFGNLKLLRICLKNTFFSSSFKLEACVFLSSLISLNKLGANL